MEELEKLIEEVEELRVRWHDLSHNYQDLPYGTERYIAQKKCRTVRNEYEQARKKLAENMSKTYESKLK